MPRGFNGPKHKAAAALFLAAEVATWGALPNAATAGEWKWSGHVAAELRIFPNSPEHAGQKSATLSPSLSFRPEAIFEWNEGADRLAVIPFGRLDAYDDNRSHADLREAKWLHKGDGWDLVIGFDVVFWGVTESRHLVDIVNQNDAVEDIDGEDKLGQPMVNFSLIGDWGTAGFFVLTGFRKRTFPDRDARLRGPHPIASEDATYDSGAKERHVDFAARWARAVGSWDIGLSYFAGTSREPRFDARVGSDGGTELVPHYDQIDQTGLDLQLTRGAWLWKLESMTRGGHGRRFLAAVGGFEHTVFGILKTAADVGLLAEYLYDDRDQNRAPPTASDDDIFLGIRLSLNDVQDTSALIGTLFDRRSGAALFSIEFERRIGDSWRFEFESRLFLSTSSDDPLAGIRNDDVMTLRLSKFF